MSNEWQEQTYGLLREAGIDQFAFVPDAGHEHLIKRSIADPEVHAIALTTEEEGVALLAGTHLGGGRGVLLMQSSGVGNCINLLSLIRAGRFPFLTLISMRGDFGEGNPWQMPMGRTAQGILEIAGVSTRMIEDAAAVAPAVAAAAERVFADNARIAVMVHQKLMPVKTFGK